VFGDRKRDLLGDSTSIFDFISPFVAKNYFLLSDLMSFVMLECFNAILAYALSLYSYS
jgi:hypothetical protein